MAEIVKFKKDEEITWLNKVKWIFLLVLFFVALFANYQYTAIPAPVRLGVWLLIAIALFGVFWWTNEGKHFLTFAKASRNEMRKVIWPTRQETVQSTIAVVVLVCILAVILWAIDSFWLWLITLITG